MRLRVRRGLIAERARQIADALFARPPAAHVLLAWDGDQLAGLAAARAFYARLGAPVRLSKVFYRVQDTGAGFRLSG